MEENSIITEVLDEIDSSINDPRGIVSHQRRLAFSLSLGTVNLIEGYLKKLRIFKSGAKINHLWLKKKRENVEQLISNQITTPVDSIPLLDKILNLAYQIEIERNKMAYGKSISEKTLHEKVNIFLELKKLLENV